MSHALLTDRYELTMVQAALESDMAQRRCVFEVFSRQLPAGRRFGVVAGTYRLIEALRGFSFSTQELEYLAGANIVNGKTLDWLANYKFSGNISGYAEGELYYPHSPVLTVEGSFAEAVVLETLILSILNFDSAVASAAARMRIAAGERTLVEMGSRRTNEQAAVSAARAAYLVGFDATSNLRAGMEYGIPTMGTSAHAFTLLHDSEEQAFKAQLAALGNQTTLLVDTFDIDQAVRKAVELSGGELGAVRIDSGDLVTTAHRVRRLLDDLGAIKTRIVVTSDLDENTIAALAQAPVDSYGVGTSVVTGSGYPTASFVYKLVAHEGSDGWVSVAKKSAGKGSHGGKKVARRQCAGQTATAELIGNPTQGRQLQVELISVGEVLTGSPKDQLEIARKHHQSVISELPAEGRRLSRGEPAIPTQLV